MKHAIALLLLLFGITCNISAHNVYIIIHGTWGSETTWYAPGGDFFDALEKTAHLQSAAVVPFHWSGHNTNQARLQASQNLVKLIETYDYNTDITIVAHSHGGNVAFLASQQLTKNRIFCLYSLGTPISTTIYPNMNKIDYCYNLFSFEDLVQPVLGVFNREHAPHERIANIRVVVNEKEPDHPGLHDPLIGTWIPTLHTLVKNSHRKFSEPGIIYFKNTQAPVYCYDEQRQKLLERDRQISLLLLHTLRNNPANKKNLDE